jgi:hypothetical protein
LLVGAVGIHDVYLKVPVPRGLENDAGAIRRPRRAPATAILLDGSSALSLM